MRARRLVAGLVAAVVALAGCASVDPDAGFAAVAQTTRQHAGKELHSARTDADREAIDRRVSDLLAGPLTADAAVQLALLNNRGLQADLQELAIGAADLAQAGRLPNPGLGLARLTRGSEVEIERGLHLDLARLLMLPAGQALEASRFGQTRGRVSARVLTLASETRKAWIDAVAAQETVRYRRQVQQAAEAGAELARRMAQVGNFNRLQRAREQLFAADAALGLAHAEQAQQAAREQLTRRLGLWGAQTAFTLPERLPDLPAAPLEQPDIERTALALRLDVEAARQAAAQRASELGLTRHTRWVNVLEVGAVRNGSNEAPTQRGWELRLELPLFDWGEARVARAEASYMQALHRAADTAVNARSQVREAYARYRSSFDIARHHRDELVPLRRQVADENLLRYNGMLIGVFELLADARLQIAAVQAALQAQRDFWLADAALQAALVGPPQGEPAVAPNPDAPADGGAPH